MQRKAKTEGRIMSGTTEKERKGAQGTETTDAKKFSYHDIDGNIIFQVRYVQGGFYITDAEGHEGALNDLNGVTLIPYNIYGDMDQYSNCMQCVLARNEDDVDILKTCGIAASCAPLRKSNWSDYVPFLDGINYYILAGCEDLAVEIAKQVEPHAISVYIMNLPEFQDDDHLSDWLMRQGNGKSAIQRAIDDARHWRLTLRSEAHSKVHVEAEEQDVKPDLTLPEEALSGICGEFVNAACRNSEADPAAVLITFLVRFGVECGRHAYFEVGDRKHFPILFAAMVGATSKARKGTSAAPVRALFEGIPDGARCSAGPLSSGEGLVYAVRDEITVWHPRKGEHHVTDPGITDKRLFVLDEEMASALSASKRRGSTLSSILRSFWDGDPVEPLTKHDAIKATGAHIGIVTHVTLNELNAQLNNIEITNGFCNRFLWVLAQRKQIVPLPESMDEQTKNNLLKEIILRVEEARQPSRYTFTEEAKELWVDQYSQLSVSHQGLTGSVLDRAEAHVIRLSLVYSLINGHRSINCEDLTSALALWSFCESCAQHIFGCNQAVISKEATDNELRKRRIIEALESATRSTLTRTEIRRDVFSNHIPAAELTDLLNELEAAGIISLQTESTPGASVTHITLNTPAQ